MRNARAHSLRQTKRTASVEVVREFWRLAGVWCPLPGEAFTQPLKRISKQGPLARRHCKLVSKFV
jgi:hypothetical protein